MRLRRRTLPEGLRFPGGKPLTGRLVRLREKKLSDVRNDYRWQTDRELARLDAAPLLKASFPIYLLDYTEQVHHLSATRYPLAIETLEGKHIGNCTCYDIDEEKGEAQLGIMIGDRDYWDKGYGADAICTLVDHIFGNTAMKRLYLKTLDWNTRAQKSFRKCGFTPCGEMKRNGFSFILMELFREQWEQRQQDS
jgi:RimJ/RimL family protein N-acetyltransferase